MNYGVITIVSSFKILLYIIWDNAIIGISVDLNLISSFNYMLKYFHSVVTEQQNGKTLLNSRAKVY